MHPKDTDECVERRVRLLVADGATTACMAISKTESRNALELLARAMLAFTEFPDIRGQILSEGGAKVIFLQNFPSVLLMVKNLNFVIMSKQNF